MNRKIMMLIIFMSLLGGFLGSYFYALLENPSEESLIRDFYQTETAVHVSPHSLRKMISTETTEFILVDLRSEEEYKLAHIKGAINIPAYKDKDTSDYSAVERIVSQFKLLPKDKDLIVYCYSTPCMTGRKVGDLLANHNIYVKHLEIGWNEWRYEWNTWNHEHEWNQTNVLEYISYGSDPGISENIISTKGCPVQGSLGC